MTAPTELPAGSHPLVLPLSTLGNLFNAPPASPFSACPSEVLGISGMDYLLPLLQMDKKRQRARTLLITLPPDQADPLQAQRTTQALHRFAQFRLARDTRELRNTYYHGWRITGIALMALALCLAISAFFASHYTDFLRPIIRHTFEYGF